MANHWERNLALLRERGEELYAAVCRAQPLGEVVPARNGLPTLVVSAGDGARRYLHSAYRPDHEAERWAGQVAGEDGEAFFVLGVGFGYHLLALARRIPTSLIVGVEPDARLFAAALRGADLSELLRERRIILQFGTRHDRVVEAVKKAVGFCCTAPSAQILTYRPVAQLYADVAPELKEELVEALLAAVVEGNTMFKFSVGWVENLLLNLPDVICSPGILPLRGLFTGRAGVIVSAGPSLDKNVALLSEVKGRAPIIAVGTALRVLLKRNLVPDLVITADGGEPNAGHFRGLGDLDIPLAFDATVYPEVLKYFPDAAKFVFVYNPDLRRWLQTLTGEDKGGLRIGPSVANLAFDLALLMGLNPVILVGQDLAFSGGRTHASDTVYGGHQAPLQDAVFVEGVNGEPVPTSVPMLYMLRKFEADVEAAGPEVRVIDATEGGARIRGTEVMPLRTVIAEVIGGGAREDLRAELRNVWNKNRPDERLLGEIVRKLRTIPEELARLGSVAGRAAKTYEELHQALSAGHVDRKRFLKKFQRLQTLDAQFGASDLHPLLSLAGTRLLWEAGIVAQDLARKQGNDYALTEVAFRRRLCSGLSEVCRRLERAALHLSAVPSESLTAFLGRG